MYVADPGTDINRVFCGDEDGVLQGRINVRPGSLEGKYQVVNQLASLT